jgi:hypothetical protein
MSENKISGRSAKSSSFIRTAGGGTFQGTGENRDCRNTLITPNMTQTEGPDDDGHSS